MHKGSRRKVPGECCVEGRGGVGIRQRHVTQEVPLVLHSVRDGEGASRDQLAEQHGGGALEFVEVIAGQARHRNFKPDFEAANGDRIVMVGMERVRGPDWEQKVRIGVCVVTPLAWTFVRGGSASPSFPVLSPLTDVEVALNVLLCLLCEPYITWMS